MKSRPPRGLRWSEVEGPGESLPEEVVRLRTSLEDLVSVVVSSGLRAHGEPRRVVSSLLDAVLGMLRRRVAEELDRRVSLRTAQLTMANEALRKAEHEARLLVDGIPGMVALLGPTGALEVVNRPVLEYFGQTLDELQRWGTNDTVHPEDLPHVIDVFSRCITSGSAYEIVQRFRRSDGVYRWFANSGSPLRDAEGRTLRWCVLLTDIDDRKRAEDGLRASERKLNLIIDTIPALAWSARPDGGAEFFSQHYLDFIGFTAEKAGGWGWLEAVHPADLGASEAAWRLILRSEAPGDMELRLRRHDGEHRWFLLRANPLRDESGSVVRWYGVNTDIEGRKNAESELRRARDSFAEAQRLSKTGSFVADLVADEHDWSDEAYRIFGFERGSKVTLKRCRDAVHPHDRPAFDEVVASALRGKDVQFVYRISTPQGALKHLRGSAHVVEQVEGRAMLIGALQDVTNSAVAEDALNRARSELAHVARVTTLSTLTASIAHEVSQPLLGIITNANTGMRMLAAEPPNLDGARETVRRTLRDGNRASEVIRRLRALYGKKEFTREPLDLSDATREVIALSWGDLQRNRVFLQSELADDLPWVTGDRVQLQQVILNLIRNASEAMVDVEGRPRRLLVRTEGEGLGRVRVVVQDSGTGIEPRCIQEMFEAFYTTKSGGMGIGLSVSRSIVERHNGRLWAEPNAGPGATFSFSIPCSPEAIR